MKPTKLIVCLGQGDPLIFFDFLKTRVENVSSYTFEYIPDSKSLPVVVNESELTDIIILTTMGNIDMNDFKTKLKARCQTIMFFHIRHLYYFTVTALQFGLALGRATHLFPGVYSFYNGETKTV